MNSILVAAAATMVLACANNDHTLLRAYGEVVECTNEANNPFLTCVKVDKREWSIMEDFDRAKGTLVELEFTMRKIDGIFYVANFRAIPMGEGDLNYK